MLDAQTVVTRLSKKGDHLFDYQVEGVQLLAPERAFLFDQMGLGKTPQSIRYADLIGAQKVLTIVPAIAKWKWQGEFDNWGIIPRTTEIVQGTGNFSPNADVTIINYDVVKDHYKVLGARDWDLAIIDEAHFLANRETLRTRATYGAEGILRRAKRVVILTGTPARNNPGELWTHLVRFYKQDMLRAGMPTDYWPFVRKYCKVWENRYGFQITGINEKYFPQLRDFVKARAIRRLIRDVLPDMPPCSFILEPLHPDDALAELLKDPQFKHVEEHKKWLVKNGASEADIGEALISLATSAESASTMRRLTGLAKVKPALDLVKTDVEGGIGKIVHFCWHTDVIDQVMAGLRGMGRNPVRVDGSTSPQKKQDAMRSFQIEPSVTDFVGQIRACGTAVDLFAASEVLFHETSGTPDDNKQAFQRVWRYGQEKHVRVRMLALAGTYDENLQEAQRRKLKMINPLFQ